MERIQDGNGWHVQDIQKEGSTPMNKPDEYRQDAVASLKLEAASNQSGKMRMLLMADAWFKLAPLHTTDCKKVRA